MIYIIVNQTHDCGELIDDKIDFVSTSLDKAEEQWETFYTSFKDYDDSKWCYSAELRAYPDGYNVYGLENSKFGVLKHIDNIKE